MYTCSTCFCIVEILIAGLREDVACSMIKLRVILGLGMCPDINSKVVLFYANFDRIDLSQCPIRISRDFPEVVGK